MSGSQGGDGAVSPGMPDSSRFSTGILAAVALVLCLLLYLRPYYGIHHDSVLYLGQALLRWKPDPFGQDLFFAYGSQAQFTIFPALVGELLRHFAAGEIFLAIALAGRLSFLLASLFLVVRLVPEGHRFWALLAVLIMPSGYGGYNVYSYGESFATSRVLAEPLILVSLGAVVRRQWFLGGAAWLLAAALHPLQALPAALLTWILLLSQDRRWLHLLWPVAGVLALAFAGVDPALPILARYDDQWLKWILAENKPVFVFQWPIADWCYLLTDAFLVFLVARSANGDIRRVARALLVTSLIAFLLSALLADVLNLVLPTGLQLWRAQWLLRWLAMASLPWLLWQQYAAGPQDRPRLLLLVAIAVMAARQLPNPSAVLILIPLFLLWPRIRDRIRPALGRLLAIAIVLGVAMIYVKVSLVAGIDVMKGASRELLRPEFMLLTQAPVAGVLVFLGLWWWRRGKPWVRGALAAILLAWLAYASLEWDRRSPAMRDIESAQDRASPFGVELERGAQVFWMREVLFEEALATWLALGKPNYFTVTQKAGLLFNRGTAEEAMARQAIVSPLEDKAGSCRAMMVAGVSAQSCLRELRDAVGDACRAAGGRMGYVIMTHDLGSGVLGTWAVSVERRGDGFVTNYLYRCSDLSSGAGVGGPSIPAGRGP